MLHAIPPMDADLRLWLRLLKEIEQIGVPTKIGDATPQFEMRAIAEMIDAGWLNGSVLPSGSRINSIQITDITRVARKAVQDNEPSERRKSFIRNHYIGLTGVAGLIVAILVWLGLSPAQVSQPAAKQNTTPTPTPTQPPQQQIESYPTPIPSPGIP